MADRVLEERQRTVNEFLKNMQEDDQEGDSEEPSPEAQTAQDLTDGMPSTLETPVSIMQTNNAEKKKKKKKKKKSKTAHLPDAGTALPDDYEEDYKVDPVENPFDLERPLSQRIEYAIWKYRKNHKFTGNKKAIFDNYLNFGGIETGPNAFLGRETGADNCGDGDQDFEAAKAETDVVRDENHDEDVEVSFTEVVQVYLGNVFVSESRFITMQDYIDAPLLIDAFLRYLQIRQVCPEHAEDLEKARAIAAQAKVELPMCKHVSVLLPGTFNKSCSLLFEGELKSAASMDMSWATTADVQNRFKAFSSAAVGLTTEEARSHVASVVSNTDNAKVVDSRWSILVQIKHMDTTEKPDGLHRVTLADFEKPNDQFEVLLEKEVTGFLRANMVMIATLYKLDCGPWYLDKTSLVSPSFYIKNDIVEEVVYEDER